MLNQGIKQNLTKQELVDILTKKLNKIPETNDVYNFSKQLYEQSMYSSSLAVLKHYTAMNGAQTAGRHLMAYCLLNMGEKEQALAEFKRCVKEGFQEDWQLVVELTIELAK